MVIQTLGNLKILIPVIQNSESRTVTEIQIDLLYRNRFSVLKKGNQLAKVVDTLLLSSIVEIIFESQDSD